MCWQVTVSVPDDVDVEMVVGAAEGEQQPEVVVATDGSLNAEVYNADFAGTPPTMHPGCDALYRRTVMVYEIPSTIL